MPSLKLIADGGATKAEWCLTGQGKNKTIFTQGVSPYFLNTHQIEEVLRKELWPGLENAQVSEIFFYGTGCANPVNAESVKNAIGAIFTKTKKIEVTHDLMGAARALCGKSKGIAANLGTGSFCCYFNGEVIIKQRPGIGYILGDEGSGAYLGKKVIQYYLYETFDDVLRSKFDAKYATNRSEILDQVYKKPFPNRYLASYAMFLAENRGHYMIENIIEDGLNDFFFNHLDKYPETRSMPVHFTGSIAHGFKDVLQELCTKYEMELGKVLKNPMEGLIEYHS